MQPHPEHKENYADFGQLPRHFRIGDEPGSIRPDYDPGDEVAEKRRQPEAVGKEPEGTGDDERSRYSRDESRLMMHAVAIFRSGPRSRADFMECNGRRE